MTVVLRRRWSWPQVPPVSGVDGRIRSHPTRTGSGGADAVARTPRPGLGPQHLPQPALYRTRLVALLLVGPAGPVPAVRREGHLQRPVGQPGEVAGLVRA